MIRLEFLNIERSIYIGPEIKKLLSKIPPGHKKVLGEINFIFTDNDTILSVNKKFLNHHYFTDVITFDNTKKSKLCGDIYISLEQVRINADGLNVAYASEVLRVMIHGILHLIGFNDSTIDEKKVMREMEDLYLCRLDENDIITGSEIEL